MGGLRFAFVLFFASEQPILRAVPLFLSLPLLLKTCFGGLSIPREKSKNFNPFFPHYEHPTSQHKRAQKRERDGTYIFFVSSLRIIKIDFNSAATKERDERTSVFEPPTREERETLFFCFSAPKKATS